MTISQEIIWREFTLLKEEIENLKDKIEEEESVLFSHEGTSDLTKYVKRCIALEKDKNDYKTHLERLIKLEERLFKKEKTIYYIKKLFNQ